jgi:hypothetical protein
MSNLDLWLARPFALIPSAAVFSLQRGGMESERLAGAGSPSLKNAALHQLMNGVFRSPE